MSGKQTHANQATLRFAQDRLCGLHCWLAKLDVGFVSRGASGLAVHFGVSCHAALFESG
jgi:hypothetical protein